MKKKKVYYCKKCGKKLERKTRSGLCGDCRIEVLRQNIQQLKEKKGEYYEKWKKGMIVALKKLLSE